MSWKRAVSALNGWSPHFVFHLELRGEREAMSRILPEGRGTARHSIKRPPPSPPSHYFACPACLSCRYTVTPGARRIADTFAAAFHSRPISHTFPPLLYSSYKRRATRLLFNLGFFHLFHPSLLLHILNLKQWRILEPLQQGAGGYTQSLF